jgi:hypothetical protein
MLIQQAQDLLEKAETLSRNVQKLSIQSDGFIKYQTAIRSEIKFLHRILQKPDDLKDAHVKCSNYTHLNAIYEIIKDQKWCQVNQIVPSRFRVDVVVDHGLTWIKVKSGSKSSLEGEVFGYEDEEDWSDSESGEETAQLALPDPAIVRQAKRWMEATKTDLVHFQSPRVVFQFVGSEAIPTTLHEQLISTGVTVAIGPYIPRELRKFHYLTPTLNLDVTTLLAMVSCITHECEQVIEEAFDSNPLRIQRESEKKNAILPFLCELFHNRTLVCCFAAFEKCKSIVEMIGGPREKSRCRSLFMATPQEVGMNAYDCLEPQPTIEAQAHDEYQLPWRVTVIKNKLDDQTKAEIGSKLHGHNLDVIGTGCYHRISTITSNIGLKRSIEMLRDYGIELHEPRGLIEQKWIRYSNKH